jgi:hypothetical protein
MHWDHDPELWKPLQINDDVFWFMEKGKPNCIAGKLQIMYEHFSFHSTPSPQSASLTEGAGSHW